MPEFPSWDPNLTREQALNMILSSIATEELALGRIIQAESEKINYVLNSSTCQASHTSVEDVLAVNRSVSSLMEVVLQNQMLLKGKMEKVLEAMPSQEPAPPPRPPHIPCPLCPPAPPGPPGSCCRCPQLSSLEIPSLMWHPCQPLPLINMSCSNASLDPIDGTTLLLPCSKRLSFNLELLPEQCRSGQILVELHIRDKKSPVLPQRFCMPMYHGKISAFGSCFIETPCKEGPFEASFRLLSNEIINIKHGTVEIVEL